MPSLGILGVLSAFYRKKGEKETERTAIKPPVISSYIYEGIQGMKFPPMEIPATYCSD
jgi:hypothetical protein